VPGSHALDLRFERRQQGGRDHGDAVIAVLPVVAQQHPPVEVDVLHPQMERFRGQGRRAHAARTSCLSVTAVASVMLAQASGRCGGWHGQDCP
jgi:hypothetical protein